MSILSASIMQYIITSAISSLRASLSYSLFHWKHSNNSPASITMDFAKFSAMCSKSLGADAVFAWPCAEIAVMGAAGAVPILYGRKLAAIEDAAEREAEQKRLYDEYVEAFYNPYAAAASDQVTEIINPKESRARIALTLRTLLGKREAAPARKHGNIPL